MERGTKSQRGREGRREWNDGRAPRGPQLGMDGYIWILVQALQGSPEFLVTPLSCCCAADIAK